MGVYQDGQLLENNPFLESLVAWVIQALKIPETSEDHVIEGIGEIEREEDRWKLHYEITATIPYDWPSPPVKGEITIPEDWGIK
jgi:hypothetical protein